MLASQHKNSSLRELDAVIAEKPSSFYDSEPVVIDDPDGQSSQMLNYNSSVEWQLNKQLGRPIRQRLQNKGNRMIEEAKHERARKFFNQFVEFTQNIDD